MKKIVGQLWLSSLIFIITFVLYKASGYSVVIIVMKPYARYLLLLPFVIINIIFVLIFFYKAKTKGYIDMILKVTAVLATITISLMVFFGPNIYILWSTSLQVFVQSFVAILSIILSIVYFTNIRDPKNVEKDNVKNKIA